MKRDFLVRLSVALLFVLLSVNLLNEFQRTHHLTGLLLLGSESLVVVLTIFRRQTSTVDRSFIAWATAFISMIGPSLVRAVDVAPLVPDAATAAVSGVGVCIVIVGKLTLGRSFGIIAANRGVVASGPYKIVRHPIYVGYLLTHVAFAAAHPTALNIALIVLGDSALIIRALCEERTLVADERYREYCHAVAWHFVPGVF